ncbi:hypothetical protein JCM30204_13530 [Dysgonomonas termitidis]
MQYNIPPENLGRFYKDVNIEEFGFVDVSHINNFSKGIEVRVLRSKIERLPFYLHNKKTNYIIHRISKIKPKKCIILLFEV